MADTATQTAYEKLTEEFRKIQSGTYISGVLSYLGSEERILLLPGFAASGILFLIVSLLTGVDLSTYIEARQKLESQLQENKIVQKEFSILEDDSKIYKLTGPVLVPQDKSEAVINVDKRLEFIESEIKRIEGQINDTRAKTEKKRAELISFQAQLQEKARS
ncbi:Prefoldin [Lipomyces tetrasporus]